MFVAVLSGGDSPEREVSLDSAKNISDVLRAAGHLVIDVDPSLSPKENFPDFQNADGLSHPDDFYYINILLLKKQNVDIVFNGLHGGKGENGIVQALMDTLHLRYTGAGSVASMLAMDKELSKMLFLQNALPTAQFVSLKKDIYKKGTTIGIGYPFVVKPADGGSTIGFSIVENPVQLEAAVKLAFRYSDKILLEDYIVGKEIAAGVLAGKALPLVHIRPKHKIYDYECKYTPGMSDYLVPADLDDMTTEKVQKMAEQVYNLLGCNGYARIDFLVREQDNQPFIMEANTLPGMTSTSLLPKAAKAVGITFEKLIDRIIEEAME